MLNKVNLQKLKIIKVLGGDVLHALKKSDLNLIILERPIFR